MQEFQEEVKFRFTSLQKSVLHYQFNVIIYTDLLIQIQIHQYALTIQPQIELILLILIPHIFIRQVTV
jgi:hypothetical protein